MMETPALKHKKKFFYLKNKWQGEIEKAKSKQHCFRNMSEKEKEEEKERNGEERERGRRKLSFFFFFFLALLAKILYLSEITK